ncbi:bifunctional diaminohydroxyphosphoribosylaminopyrimidine deaminase/5-amino-6-(5-phosphoribosylamino)uracil reductase RibD [Anaeromyxobacter diazotrophicus]|uniref:bifunctional diaminohydroxyphosphoribosylaminopyrimidine deaminase/5-amino-6-(5-phosphoribosylamino)uracil reductase RibD n=1 Tax=Anaeromyxobacter diazotrophicus TaxID=2590199 RepID=UPI001591D4D4|nr:bifunctional diaminohydroxyphosphoribosylaminopyrimidine deaminase/5-amino-6-(5-phosphoribosylamino)uracil reductase RibD [Anaeromyxobacter diazotrophicus]
MSDAPERFMRLALREAAKGLGRTHPNPPVGAVLVKAGRVVARGHHARAGGPHAEVVALRAAGAAARGADLYTTLEPCDHFGKTPPCSRALLAAGVRRVFVGSRDPNPLVKGRGVRRLRRAGVEVVQDVARPACDALIAPWLRFIETGRPFVTLKAAVTLDGKIATAGGDARWVTGEAARREVHRLRDQVDAVLVGAGTARQDDPILNTRLPGGRGHDPVRVVLDARLRLPPTLRMFTVASEAPALVATLARGGEGRHGPGVTVLHCAGRGGRVDLDDLLARLGALGLTHLLVEGGAELHAAFLAAGLVDRVLVHLAPRILGGGKDWLSGPGPARMADALPLVDVSVRRLGGDLAIEGRPDFAAAGAARRAGTGRSAARARPARAPRAARRRRA